MANIPPAEVHLNARLVAGLLADQCPALSGLSLSWFANGWDNELFTLGEDLLVRLPRRSAAATLIKNEIAALPRIADRLPVPVPAAVFHGGPGRGYPWEWAVVPRLPGRCAAEVSPADRAGAATDLAEFFGALHQPAPSDAPVNPFRGVSLAERADLWLPRIEQFAGKPAAVRWREAAAAPSWSGPPLWLHGDPHPLNLLLSNGRLSAVIDFGDICSGDPASDLATAWLTFDAPARSRFRQACTQQGLYDRGIWLRAWAWALGLSAAFAAHSDDQPALAAIAEHGLRETLSEQLSAL